MITGKESASGQYSYHCRSSLSRRVFVSRMPEAHNFRIVFQSNGETVIPVLSIDEIDAELLWAALNETAKQFGWKVV